MLVAVLLGVVAAPIASPAEVSSRAPRDGRKTHATWYTGSQGACGALNGRYAASKFYKCGQKVKVTHKHRQVVVTIMDRCQCMMDMSKGAFSQLASPSKGVIVVRLYKRG
jgi:rare lipoprotein A (peptidoglycan hydrolase)